MTTAIPGKKEMVEYYLREVSAMQSNLYSLREWLDIEQKKPPNDYLKHKLNEAGHLTSDVNLAMGLLSDELACIYQEIEKDEEG